MSRARTAIVVGGGIAGPAAALALQRAGIEATVHEAHAQGRQDEGTMIALASNGIAALDVLDAGEAVRATGFPTPGITLRSGSGKVLGVTRTGGSLADSPATRTMRRSDLYAALLETARDRGIAVHHGKRFVAAEDTGTGVRAHFADGSQAEADVLVGADGIHSAVRRVVDAGVPTPTYAGLVTTGGYAPRVEVDALPGNRKAPGDREVPGHYEMVFGRRAFFGYAVAPDGEVWWFVNVPRRAEPARGEVESVTTDQWRTELAELYRDDASPAVEILAATPDFAPMTPIHLMPRLSRWHQGRTVIIGDAAHAPSPTSGQGASLSVEDAVVLATALRDHDVAEALARFEAARRPRVERIVRAAARINNAKAAGPVGRRVRDAMLPLVLRAASRGNGPDAVLDHRVRWEVGAV